MTVLKIEQRRHRKETEVKDLRGGQGKEEDGWFSEQESRAEANTSAAECISLPKTLTLVNASNKKSHLAPH